jgi:uncharacterized membrane protein YcaP (DUF421 family)
MYGGGGSRMERVGVIAFDVLATMVVLLAIWLAMGHRQMGTLTPFDFIVSITAGTVAGAGIVDPRIELGDIIVTLTLIGAAQVAFSWLSVKFRGVYKRSSPAPAVLVENGQIIKANLRKVRLTAEMLLQLLRGKSVFDITEVEVAVLEPNGRLSVLKRAEFLPLTPNSVNLAVAPNKILLPVILDGQLQEDILMKMGFSEEQILEFRRQYRDRLNEVFVAFMDKDGQLHIIKEGVREQGTFLH